MHSRERSNPVHLIPSSQTLAKSPRASCRSCQSAVQPFGGASASSGHIMLLSQGNHSRHSFLVHFLAPHWLNILIKQNERNFRRRIICWNRRQLSVSHRLCTCRYTLCFAHDGSRQAWRRRKHSPAKAVYYSPAMGGRDSASGAVAACMYRCTGTSNKHTHTIKDMAHIPAIICLCCCRR